MLTHDRLEQLAHDERQDERAVESVPPVAPVAAASEAKQLDTHLDYEDVIAEVLAVNEVVGKLLIHAFVLHAHKCNVRQHGAHRYPVKRRGGRHLPKYI